MENALKNKMQKLNYEKEYEQNNLAANKNIDDKLQLSENLLQDINSSITKLENSVTMLKSLLNPLKQDGDHSKYYFYSSTAFCVGLGVGVIIAGTVCAHDKLIN